MQQLLFEYFGFNKYNILFSRDMKSASLSGLSGKSLYSISEKKHCTETTVERIMGKDWREGEVQKDKRNKKQEQKVKLRLRSAITTSPSYIFWEMKTLTTYG